MRGMRLWQAVALLLSFSPDARDLRVYQGAVRVGDDPFRITPPQFRDLLETAVSNASVEFNARPDPAWPSGAFVYVDAVEIGAWAVAKGLLPAGLPERFPSGDCTKEQAADTPKRRPSPGEVPIAPSSAPTLSTDEVCQAFAGFGWQSDGWRRVLTKDCPDWVMACRVSRGKQGGFKPTQPRWDPLKIAEALVKGKAKKAGPQPAAALDRAFNKQPLLRSSLDAWKEIRADNPAWGD